MGLSATATPSSARAQTLQCLDRLPKLSPLMTQLLARVSRRNCDVQELTEIVEKDPVLSAQILRLANSAIFGRLRPVGTVRHAVAMVGIGTMRKFALGSSISNLFSRTKIATSFSMLRFNLHSVATATLVEILAAEVPFEAPGDAFLAGLLHDIGKLLIAVNFPQQYDDILSLAAVNGAPLVECERTIVGIDHAELSGMAVSRWELSEPVQWAACYHHEPAAAAAVERPRAKKAGLSLGVHHADLFVNQVGMSVLPARPASAETSVPGEASVLKIPGFSFPEARVIERFQTEVKDLRDLFR
jgi:HD-like signal output (HDOD) protein